MYSDNWCKRFHWICNKKDWKLKEVTFLCSGLISYPLTVFSSIFLILFDVMEYVWMFNWLIFDKQLLSILFKCWYEFKTSVVKCMFPFMVIYLFLIPNCCDFVSVFLVWAEFIHNREVIHIIKHLFPLCSILVRIKWLLG